MAHGQEVVPPPGTAPGCSGDGNQFTIQVLDGAADATKIRVIANGEALKMTRTMAGKAVRELRGGGGGSLVGR